MTFIRFTVPRAPRVQISEPAMLISRLTHLSRCQALEERPLSASRQIWFVDMPLCHSQTISR